MNRIVMKVGVSIAILMLKSSVITIVFSMSLILQCSICIAIWLLSE